MRFLCLLLLGFALVAQAPHVPLSAPGYDLGKGSVFNLSAGTVLIPSGPLPLTCVTGQIQLNNGYLAVCTQTAVWQATPLTIAQLSGTLTYQH